jgi:hypothetical protein
LKLYNVYTPTLGEEGLEDTIESVQTQSYSNVKHTLVTDTEKGHDQVRTILNKLKPKNTLHFVLPEKISKDGQFRPEHISSGMIHLVNYDYWQPLGTGDWLDRQHFQNINFVLEKHNVDWVFAFRNIYDKNKKFICKDIFESIGFYPVWSTENYYIIDGQSWCVSKKMLMHLGNCFRFSRENNQRTDKFVFDVFSKHYPKLGCTNEFTINFRLNRGNDEELEYAKQWYLTGHKEMVKRFPDGKYPWVKDVF